MKGLLLLLLLLLSPITIVWKCGVRCPWVWFALGPSTGRIRLLWVAGWLLMAVPMSDCQCLRQTQPAQQHFNYHSNAQNVPCPITSPCHILPSTLEDANRFHLFIYLFAIVLFALFCAIYTYVLCMLQLCFVLFAICKSAYGLYCPWVSALLRVHIIGLLLSRVLH